MTYAVSAALQEAVFQKLSTDVALTALVGTAIYDALPAGTLSPTYVTLGPEDVRQQSDKTTGGAWHNIIISVITDSAGFFAAKQVAAAISDALVDANLTLTRGQLAGLYFSRAKARRGSTGQLRRIDLTFRARVDDTTTP